MPVAASSTLIPPVESVSSFSVLPSLLRGGVKEYDICGYCLWPEQRAEAASQQVVALREEISRMDALFYAARQAQRQEMARAAMLERELAQTREAHAAREKEILELINERDWLRQFIAQFLGTTRDSVDRARDELESRPGCSSSQCPQADRLRVVGLRVGLQRALASLPPMGFAAAVEAATQTEMADQAVI
ncbi:hypothetical protein M9H77_20845 [Catharanthus roseus]|uniref:Uncharacterized protein n=1 Tax=Catharanthus roseus TaxID=4058 RepID=A0ACC0AM52_CATRO|nr:hypothetical protein M9H77_20845 [Catharanthus roseus]